MNIEMFWVLRIIVSQKDKNQKNKNNRIDNRQFRKLQVQSM